MKIPYYVVVSGRGYWRPTKAMRDQGFSIVRCGKDGPDAWKVAAIWNERWQRFRRGESVDPITTTKAIGPEAAEAAIVYPKGSLGEAFGRYRRTDAWGKDKQSRTREDWWRGWKRIRPIFGDLPPSGITLEDISAWRSLLVDRHGVREAHRAIKIWRAMWKVSAAMGYCSRDADPSLAVRNRAAPGRSDRWTEGEVVQLVKMAWRRGYFGLAAIMAVIWDSQLSPGDARALLPGQIARNAHGAVFFTDRGKTGAEVIGVLSRRATAVLDAYVAGQGYTPMAHLPLFRSRGLPETTTRGGRPRPGVRYTKDILAEEFRVIRTATFGEGERRQLADFRRSGAVEAIAGGVEAEKLSRAMGNTLSTSNALFETYVPADPSMARDVAAARRRGRQKMRDGNE